MSQPQDTKAPSDETPGAVDGSDTVDTNTERNQPVVEWFDAESSVPAAKCRHLISYLVIPLLVMCLAPGAGYLKYLQRSVAGSQAAATSSVRAAASVSVSVSENHAVVLVLVNQSVIVGDDAPSATASAVQVTLEKVGSQWLISGFDPK